MQKIRVVFHADDPAGDSCVWAFAEPWGDGLVLRPVHPHPDLRPRAGGVVSRRGVRYEIEGVGPGGEVRCARLD